jgi:plastocyanin
MYFSGWTMATGRGFASILMMFIPTLLPASQDDSRVQRVEVDLGDYQFNPKTLSIAAGEKVELILTNRDSFIPHNFIVEAPEAGMDIRTDVPTGKSVRVLLEPTRPGTYVFYCDEQFLFFENHREQGMEGRIQVTGASG